MNLGFVRCAICGYHVDVFPHSSSETSWANQFRALLHTPDRLLLTGVGVLYDGPSPRPFYAPLDKDMHWSDAGFEPSGDNTFEALPQRDHRGRQGIVFHDACWSLLEAALQPASISLHRLFDVCTSLPVPRQFRAPAWGHDFGGVTVIDKIVHFPWEDGYEITDLGTPMDPIFMAHPYQAPGVDRLLAEEPQQPPIALHPGPARPPQGLALDCFFMLLPRELCAAIAILLPTADVLRARLASQAFWPAFHSQQFWASRFMPLSPAADRSWLFEARHIPSARDWRWLYRRTNDGYLSPGLRNRRRIWGLIEQTINILGLVWNELPASLPEAWSLGSASHAAEHCVVMNGLLWDPTEPNDKRLYSGCRLSRTQIIAIPGNLERLLVHTAAFGDGRYVVGMTLANAAREMIRLGYNSSSCYSHSIDLVQIWGFRVAVGSRGLQALQCVTGPKGSVSLWSGCPDDVPRTERLVVNDRVAGLEVGFDGCKVVKLAVRTRSQPSRHNDLGGLRDAAIWYPTIPSRNLCLNEESFPAREFHSVGYEPLFWCHFGGPCGKYLRHLTGIEIVSNIGILRIRFSFDIEVPWEYRSFGRLSLNEGCEELTNFSLDGPGGERIESIKMRHYYPNPDTNGPCAPQEGYMVRCKLYTNRGRSCFILRIKHKRPYVSTKVAAAPGTAITGLYGTQSEVPDNCDETSITAIGVVTEEVGKGDDA